MRFTTLLQMADQLLLVQVRGEERRARNGMTATFMPKPLFGDNGSGMHTHQSIWKDGKPLFAGDGYAGLSQDGPPLHRRRAQALARDRGDHATRRPTRTSGWCRATRRRSTSRYRRATARRRAGSRCTRTSPKAKRVEVRYPDPACNPYLAFAAMLMAGIDGIENKIDPGPPLDKNIYALSPEELKNVPTMPGSLDEALERARGRPRLPAQGRRVHRGRARDLDRLQARGRGRSGAHAAASARVRALLRRIDRVESQLGQIAADPAGAPPAGSLASPVTLPASQPSIRRFTSSGASCCTQWPTPSR